MLNKHLFVELSKFCSFFVLTVLLICHLQKRHEKLANQFSLNELVELHHQKNYSSNSIKLPVCSLYPQELGKHYLNVKA